MNQVLKTVINKTIAMEFINYQDNFCKKLKKNIKLNEEYEIYSSKVDDLIKQFKKDLSEDQQELLEELVGLIMTTGQIESEVAFKEGLVLGVTKMNYLNEVGLEIAII